VLKSFQTALSVESDDKDNEDAEGEDNESLPFHC